MKSIPILLLALIPAVQGVRIVHSNDDGWAELTTRVLTESLISAGHVVVLSAPAENKSGTSSSDEPPTRRRKPCQYDSCPANSGPIGYNSSRPDLNWVNSFPVTSMKYGIDFVGPQLWNGAGAELAVSGPNVGSNLFLAVPFSGTVGAACFATNDRGIPSIAFSVGDTKRSRWDVDPVPQQTQLYAHLATNLTNHILSTDKPYLPDGVFLNVNFPKSSAKCSHPDDFKWVLTRINPGIFSVMDITWCGTQRLPTEWDVYDYGECHIPVSIGDARDKTTMNDMEKQLQVLDKLKPILSCFPPH